MIPFPHSRYSISPFSKVVSYVSSFSRVSFHYLLIAFTATAKPASLPHYENAVVSPYRWQRRVKDNSVEFWRKLRCLLSAHRKTWEHCMKSSFTWNRRHSQDLSLKKHHMTVVLTAKKLHPITDFHSTRVLYSKNAKHINYAVITLTH